MTRARRWSRRVAHVGAVLLPALLAGCVQNGQDALKPAGQGARVIAPVAWTMFGMAAVIFLGVMALLAWALFRPRGEGRRGLSDRSSHGLVIGGGFVLPMIVLPILMGILIGTLRTLNGQSRTDALQVTVTAHDWWWEFEYPHEQVTTATELHIPAGRPVVITGTSADVIHSFWAPALHGKIDMIPGIQNSIRIEVDQPGTYRGQCAEFCGTQHAHMAFWVIVDSPTDFAAWMKAQQQPAVQPDSDSARRGEQVFTQGVCAACHTIRGTSAHEKVGPDLTHLQSRTELAGGVFTNSRSALGTWITSPQAIKAGANMPPTVFSSADLKALLDYLESLK